jgi:hypothetical protein
MMLDLIVPQKICSLLVCVVLSSGPGCSNWSKTNIELSKQQGDKIVAAITQYQQENSTYPSSLTELVPQQLNAIEGPVAGTGNWRYQPRKEGGGFTLSFESNGGYPQCYYDSELGDWIDDR